jgi:transcriptional regulator with XRE-family HTH domain
MEASACQPAVEKCKRQWRPRQEAAEAVAAFERESTALGVSQHEYARRTGIPRTTLQWWLNRLASIDDSSATVRFLESPEGLELLHRAVLAAQFVITLRCAGGIRQVCSFLELSGLSRFVASSYGVQQQRIAKMEEEVGSFGDETRRELGATMRRKAITVGQDETFHPQTCLVGLEPASGFILLEQYAQKRDAETWTRAMAEATKDLAVEIRQSTGDEALALIKHAEADLEAHHSPDLFHVQYEIGKGTSNTMAQRVRAAQKVVEDCAQLFQRSSSSVEGRNGHLDLFHHGHHRLPARKLRALTTVHNYFKRRPDGATAAERFFEAEHAELFERLIDRLEPLPRPAKRRSGTAS